MMKNLQKMLSKHGLTLSCQSGRKASVLAGLLAVAGAAPAMAGPVNWAHQATGFQSNGAVTVKSLAGGSYAGTQNPAGAVAKANQNAATQPPTVIIQATSAGYAEAIPLLIAGSVPPSCPASYTRVFTMIATGCPNYQQANPVFNVAGSRWSLITIPNPSGGGYASAAWVADQAPSYNYNSTPTMVGAAGASCQNGYSTYAAWSASLCTK
jgi:hypothetical protein